MKIGSIHHGHIYIVYSYGAMEHYAYHETWDSKGHVSCRPKEVIIIVIIYYYLTHIFHTPPANSFDDHDNPLS
jgi:hypothetical protein